MTVFEWSEFLSYVVTVVGFPFALVIFIYENRKERQNEDEELHQRLADDYSSFLKLLLENSDLHLLRRQPLDKPLTEDQIERKFALFGILVSLFERAYIMVYDDKMSKQAKRLWLSWEDYMREWCRRDDFRALLSELLDGEDENFSAHIRNIAGQESAKKTGG
jgi:hypothetical protein